MILSPSYRGAIARRPAAALAAAPEIADFKITPFPTSASVHNFATSGLVVTSRRAFVAISTNGSGASLTSFLGDGAGGDQDTSANVQEVDSNPRLHLREMTMPGGIDVNWVLTLDASSRPVILALAIAGLVTIPTPATNTGTGAALPSHAAFGVTGGPHNLLVTDIANIMGAHVTNPMVAPAGHTLVAQAASGTNDPLATVRTTLAIAERTYAVADLTWTDGATTIPAATWQGLDDIGTQSWRTIRFVGVPG